MLRTFWIVLLCAVIARSAEGQSSADIAKLLERLDKVEDENRKLIEEIQRLRQDLAAMGQQPNPETAGKASTDERLDVQESRTEELAQTKVEASQKLPISLTGMLLFNAFTNGKYSGDALDPVVAQRTPGGASAGASLRQTVLGLKFAGPDLPWGGKASGSLYMDFFAGSYGPDYNLLRIRVASLDLNWKDTTISFAQDKPIIAPREPTSLAQVGVSPLTAAGNLWDWRPQARIEHRFHWGDDFTLRAQGGVYQTAEGNVAIPTSAESTLETARPGYEGRLEFASSWNGLRVEIAPGYHASNSHVIGTSVPSRIASLDWLVRPAKIVEFTGAWFQGRNVSVLGALRQGYRIPPSGTVIPVHSAGGWGQLAIFPTERLSFHFYGGQQHDRTSDLGGSGISRNFTYAGNFMYRLAPNILGAFEYSQTRTTYLGTGTRLNNHYDLALAYLF
jgi:hypothetical protein